MADTDAQARPVVVPLTPLQSSMLAATRAAGDSGVYISQAVFELSGPVDIDRWTIVWQQLAERHEALRAVFVVDRQGESVQALLADVSVTVNSCEASDVAELTTVLGKEGDPVFSIDSAPLFRLALIDGPDGVFRHAITFHHALLDGWSVELLLAEALSLYRGETLDPAPPLRRYLAWYRKQQETAQVYWKQTLTDWSGPCRLPGDSLDDGHGVQVGSVEQVIDRDVVDRLRDAAEPSGLTLNSVLAGVWFALLSRVCSEDDVVVGMVNAGRDVPVADIGRIVGLVMNALPLRLRVDPAERVTALAKRAQQRIGEGSRHSHLPLGQMLASAGLSAVGSPYDSMLVFEQVVDAPDSPGIRVTRRHYSDRSSLPLSVLVFPEQWTLRLRFQHNLSRLSPAIVESLCRRFDTGFTSLWNSPNGQRAR